MIDSRDRSRAMRMAIAGVAQGLPQRVIARNAQCSLGEVDMLVRDAIERCGFRASNAKRFTGHSVIVPDGGVYAVGAAGLGVVKIGWTENLERRMEIIGQGVPVPTIFLGLIRNASLKTERRLHLAMAQWHQKGEWFRLTKDSVRFLQSEFAAQFDPHLLSEIGVANG